MWYKIKKNLYKKVKKKICIAVNFFIWIVIKNYWCNIKNESVLMLIVIEKCKKKKKKKKYE
jgi:hypothetical protein